jgi:hypothetical protein
LVALLLATVSILFFGAFSAITGISFIIQPFIQMIGGFLIPGKPMANMFFVLFGYSGLSCPTTRNLSRLDLWRIDSVKQAQLLLRDLKFAQCMFVQEIYVPHPLTLTHIRHKSPSPRRIHSPAHRHNYWSNDQFQSAFACLVSTAMLMLAIVIMNSILAHQRDILLSVEGTNIWSGQQVQEYNSQAVTWGAFSHELFAAGKRYQWVTWGYVLGLFIPIPLWLVHRYYPKLRADYLYTPTTA